MPLNNQTRSVHNSKVSYPPTTPPTPTKKKVKRNPINIEIYKENSPWERISYSTRPLKCATWFYFLGLVSSLPMLIKHAYFHRHRHHHHHIIWIKHWLWCLHSSDSNKVPSFQCQLSIVSLLFKCYWILFITYFSGAPFVLTLACLWGLPLINPILSHTDPLSWHQSQSLCFRHYRMLDIITTNLRSVYLLNFEV